MTTGQSRDAHASSAREILKRRDKPYRPEQSLLKKKKLSLHTSYNAAPPGYIFVPLGTPELAELCKEISRQREYPVNIVNAKPASKTVLDPEKISHHIQRIGYHFRNEAVEQACAKLKYTIFEGQFISEAELQNRQNQSLVARVMEKYGMKNNIRTKETPEQVAGAIKELFPKIPDRDLREIVDHAWAEGSERIGTVSNVDLSRRVQLAVIARIRHNYTDYDQLLKAFDWAHARKEVEPECLKKLIEWRGEDGEDDGLEEIVRETIVIDDDAPRVRQTQRDFTPGGASDTSIEIVHQPAIAHDLRAEEPQEQQHRYFEQPARMTFTERNNIARAKIEAVRGQMRAQPQEVVTRVEIADGAAPPKEIIIDGVVMRRSSPIPRYHQQPMQYTQARLYQSQDVPVQSIEAQHHRNMSQQPRFGSQPPRHGQPSTLQYIRLNENQPRPLPPTYYPATGGPTVMQQHYLPQVQHTYMPFVENPPGQHYTLTHPPRTIYSEVPAYTLPPLPGQPHVIEQLPPQYQRQSHNYRNDR